MLPEANLEQGTDQHPLVPDITNKPGPTALQHRFQKAFEIYKPPCRPKGCLCKGRVQWSNASKLLLGSEVHFDILEHFLIPSGGESHVLTDSLLIRKEIASVKRLWISKHT